jgi:hypothetical protein
LNRFSPWIFVTALAFTVPAAAAPLRLEAEQTVAGATLAYVSDYFSFVGRDDNGVVALALDTNRGRDGGHYQADHSGVFFAENGEWMPLQGMGLYPNPANDLFGLVNSGDFEFKGTPETGLTVTSPTNAFELDMAPLIERSRARGNGALFAMGSSSATLRWNGRELRGRVIWEYLAARDMNVLVKPLKGGLPRFQGLYLVAGASYDLYLQSARGALSKRLGKTPVDFFVVNGATQPLSGLAFKPVAKRLAWGLYRWPTRWRATWNTPAGPAVADISDVRQKNVKNWSIGGYNMSFVSGTLRIGDRTWPLVGFGETIVFF